MSRHPAMILARFCHVASVTQHLPWRWDNAGKDHVSNELSVETQIRIIENIFIYSQVLRRRLEPSLDKNVPSSIFMKNTPVESFKHVYTGSIRKEILHSWTCPHVVTRLLANATNDNLRVKWEVSFSFKTARWCFFWCLQSPLFLWPTTPPVKLWGKTLGREESLASLHLLGQNLIAGWSANSKVNQCHKHFRADFTSVQKCIRADDKAFVLMPPLVKRFTRCQKETRDR